MLGDRGGGVGDLGWEVGRLNVYPNADDDSEVFGGVGGFGEDAADLFALDVEVVDPFDVGVDTKFAERVVDGDAGHKRDQRQVLSLDPWPQDDAEVQARVRFAHPLSPVPSASSGLLPGDNAQTFLRPEPSLLKSFGVGRVDGVEGEKVDVHSLEFQLQLAFG